MTIFLIWNFWKDMKLKKGVFRHSLFFLADNSESGRQSLQTWSDKVREERRPKPFRRTIIVYTDINDGCINNYLIQNEIIS